MKYLILAALVLGACEEKESAILMIMDKEGHHIRSVKMESKNDCVKKMNRMIEANHYVQCATYQGSEWEKILMGRTK